MEQQRGPPIEEERKELVTSPVSDDKMLDGFTVQDPNTQNSLNRVQTAHFADKEDLEQRESRPRQMKDSKLIKKANTYQTSLNVSTNAGSNSRPGSALKSGPGKAHQYAMLKQLRPQSANITPALAYKRQAADQQLRKGTQTPAKKNTPLIQGKHGLNNKNYGVTPFNNSFADSFSKGVGSANKKPNYIKNAAITYTITQSAGSQSLNNSSIKKQSKTMRSYRKINNQSSTASFVAPGSYNPKIEPVRQRSPSALILPEGAHPSINQNNPGPGEYKTLEDFGKDARAVTILPEHHSYDPRSHLPGPGAYQPNLSQVQESVRNTKISPSRSPPAREDGPPGPGSYDFTMKNIGKDCIGYSMLQSERKSSTSPNPGPGAYNPDDRPTRERSPEYTFKGTKRGSNNESAMTNPQLGPGFYKIKEFFGREGPKYSIKPGKESNRQSQVPGPGFYNPNDSVIKEKVKSIKMIQTSKSVGKVDYTPAPGQYNVDKSFGQDAPKYSMQPKSKSRLEISPGPGKYNPELDKVLPKSQAWKFSPSRQSRDESRNAFSPGPGQYKTIDTFGKHGPKLSIGGKTSSRNPDQVPGPGYYQPNLTVVKEAPKRAAIAKSSRGDIVAKDRKYMPGPGQYDSPIKFGKDGPKVSIHERIKQLSRNLNPGPADYNPHDTVVRLTSPKYKISQASDRTNSIRKELVPGPGSYDLKSKLCVESPQYSIAAKRDGGPLNNNPGPSDYVVNDRLVRENSPGKSIPKAERGASSNYNSQPGPGQYEDSAKDKIKYAHLSYTVPQGERMSPLPRDRRLNPGPGTYDGQSPFGQDGLHYSMRGRSPNPNGEEYPGPGEYYNDKSLIGGPESLRYSIGEKRDGRVGNNNPGPADYSAKHEITHQRAPAAFITGTSKGSPLSRDLVDQPGPGAYNGENAKDQRYKNLSYQFPQGERMSPMSRDQRLNPGPAAYHTVREGYFGRDGIKYSIGARSPTKIQESQPGPGHYSPFKSFIDLRALLGKINPFCEGPIIKATPGPGDYNPEDHLARNRSPEYKMHRSSSQGRLSQVGRDALLSPGPGHYKLKPSLIGEAIAYTIGEKRGPVGVINNPGPGTYNPDDTKMRHSSPQWKVSQTARGGSIPKEITERPGPGTYDGKYDQKYKDIKYSFSLLERPDQVSRDQRQFPGPGNYTERFDQDFGRDAPKYTIGARPDLDQIEDVPGPGHYKNPQCFTELKAPLGFINPDLGNGPSGPNYPGPGSYNPDDHLTHLTAPKYTFSAGTERGMSPAHPHELGPGQYELKPLIGGDGSLAYTIGERRDIQPGTIQPGPGYYNPQVKVTQDQAPNYTIGGIAPRINEVPKDLAQNPGPGSYSQSTLIGGKDGIFYSIGEKRDIVPGNQNPGPGHYNPNDSLVYPNAPSAFISPSEKPTNYTLDSFEHPGPGFYNPIDNSYPNISYKFSQTERPNTVSRDQRAFPGPGVYATPELLGQDTPAYTIGERHQAGKQDDFPGPGSYNHAKSMSDLQGVTLGIIHPVHSQDPTQPFTPGPGEYTLGDISATKMSSPAPTFSKTQRDFLNNPDHNSANLGPGAYNPVSPQTQISFTIGEKLPDPRDNGYPGPGAYSVSHTQNETRSPEYDFTRSPDRFGGDFSRNVSLGPGAYDISASKEQVLSNNPTSVSHSFSKLVRDYPPTVSETPGPGQYRIPVKFGEEHLYAMPVVNPDFKYV